MDYSTLLFYPNPLQTYALTFLLGSLTVSSLSDLKRMAAQTDFAEVWAAFTLLMFAADVYLGMSAQLAIAPFACKWAIILLFAAVTSGGRALSISTMDVAAIIALLSCMPLAYIILALLLLLVVNELLKPILAGYGEAGAYPFLPTVLTVNLMLLVIVVAGGIEPYFVAGPAT